VKPVTDFDLRAFLAEALSELADAVFPPVCPLCRGLDGGDGLGCDPHRLRSGLHGPRCGRCAAPLPPALANGERCAACRLEPPAFKRLLALGEYRAESGLREWILALKHGRRPDLARTLGRALGARLAEQRSAGDDAPVVLVPVPLHWMRRLERGYDQALLLARAAAEVEDVPVVRALARRRATAVQGALGSPSRTANVHAAFAPRRILGRDLARRIAGVEAWIVDDVVTSGATANECARVLKRMGASRVNVLALARA